MNPTFTLAAACSVVGACYHATGTLPTAPTQAAAASQPTARALGPLGAPIVQQGQLAANTSTTIELRLERAAAYLLSIALTGDFTDDRTSVVVHVPLNPNLNVAVQPLLQSHYQSGRIAVTTSNGEGGWAENPRASYTVHITLATGDYQADWRYTALRIL